METLHELRVPPLRGIIFDYLGSAQVDLLRALSEKGEVLDLQLVAIAIRADRLELLRTFLDGDCKDSHPPDGDCKVSHPLATEPELWNAGARGNCAALRILAEKHRPMSFELEKLIDLASSAGGTDCLTFLFGLLIKKNVAHGVLSDCVYSALYVACAAGRADNVRELRRWVVFVDPEGLPLSAWRLGRACCAAADNSRISVLHELKNWIGDSPCKSQGESHLHLRKSMSYDICRVAAKKDMPALFDLIAQWKWITTDIAVYALNEAASEGRADLMRHIRKHIDTDIRILTIENDPEKTPVCNQLLISASCFDHVEACAVARTFGAENFQESLEHAAYNASPNAIRLLVGWGREAKKPIDVNAALNIVAGGFEIGPSEIDEKDVARWVAALRVLKELGATNFAEAADRVTSRPEIREMILSWAAQ